VSEDHPENMTTWERGDNNAEILKDLVGYGLGDTSQPDSDRGCDSQVDATMGKETNTTEESGVSNDHLLGYEDGGEWEVEFDPTSGTGISDTLGLISCHYDTNNPINILGNRDEWPIGSARFFVRDHKNQGEGLKGLVFNSVIDLKVYSDFSSLSVEDMFFHLHIASIHYGLPTTKSVDLATMILHNIS